MHTDVSFTGNNSKFAFIEFFREDEDDVSLLLLRSRAKEFLNCELSTFDISFDALICM